MKRVKHLATGEIFDYEDSNLNYVIVKKHKYGMSQYDPTDDFEMIYFKLDEVEIFEEK